MKQHRRLAEVAVRLSAVAVCTGLGAAVGRYALAPMVPRLAMRLPVPKQAGNTIADAFGVMMCVGFRVFRLVMGMTPREFGRRGSIPLLPRPAPAPPERPAKPERPARNISPPP
jgi:hypothetical protein